MLLGLTALFDCDLVDAVAQASDALSDARALDDRVNACPALALSALAVASDAKGSTAREETDAAAGALEALTESEQATRLPALWMVARVRRVLGDFEQALEILGGGMQLAERTGRETACHCSRWSRCVGRRRSRR